MQHWKLCPQRWAKFPMGNQQIIGAMFASLSLEIVPPIVDGKTSKFAHVRLLRFQQDMTQFAKVSPEIYDLIEDLDSNFTKLFDQNPENEDFVLRFVNADATIIRHSHHKVSVPPPADVPSPPIPTPEHVRPSTRPFRCTVVQSGGACHTCWKTKRALLAHIRFQHSAVHLLGFIVRCNECPYCRSRFANRRTAQQHIVNAVISSKCVVDQQWYGTLLGPLETLECLLCNVVCASHDSFQRRIIRHSLRAPKWIEFPPLPKKLIGVIPGRQRLYSALCVRTRKHGLPLALRAHRGAQVQAAQDRCLPERRRRRRRRAGPDPEERQGQQGQGLARCQQGAHAQAQGDEAPRDARDACEESRSARMRSRSRDSRPLRPRISCSTSSQRRIRALWRSRQPTPASSNSQTR